MSLSRQMDKKAVVHIHNGVLLAVKKNTFESVLMRWMKLELIIQSEVSQKENLLFHLRIFQSVKESSFFFFLLYFTLQYCIDFAIH